MTFSDAVRNKAIVSSSNEFAWRLQDVFNAINEITNHQNAILGGDVWALTSKQKALELLIIIDLTTIAIGIIKGRDGAEYVFQWACAKKAPESWDDFVKRSEAEAILAIKKLNAEETVADEFKNSIFYNLVYADKEEYESLH